MTRKILFGCAFVALFCQAFSAFAQAQSFVVDTTFITAARQDVFKQYQSALRHQQRIYSGRAYNEYLSQNQEHPYFLSGDFVTGRIHYDTDWFENVPLMYDLSKDKLISASPQGEALELVKEKVENFFLDGHEFIRIDDQTSLDAGFYELLYDGQTKAVARYTKRYQETIQGTKFEKRFDETTRIYVYHGGKFYSIKSKKALFKLLEGKRDALRSYARKNKLRFKSDKKNSIIKLTQFYDLPNS